MRNNKLRFGLLLLVGGMSPLTEVMAGGYGIRLHNAQQIGAAYAYGAALQGIEGLIDNPAAGAYQMTNAVLATMTPIIPSVKFRGDNGVSTRDAAVTAVVPSFSALYRINDRLSGFFTADTPFGLKTDYADDFIGNRHNLLSDMITHRFGLGLSFKVNDYLAIGAAFQTIYTNVEMTRYVMDARSIWGPLPNDNLVSRVKGKGWSQGGSLGFMVTPTPTVRIGFSYTSPQKVVLEGSQRTNIRPADAAAIAGLNAAAAALSARLLPQSATAHLKHPGSFRLSGMYDCHPMLSLMGSAQYYQWSSIKTLNIVSERGSVTPLHFNWRDTWTFSVGTEIRPSDLWKVRFGFGIEQGAPRNETLRTPGMPDAGRTIFSLGATRVINKSCEASFGYGYEVFDFARINQPATPGAVAALNVPALSGSYRSSAHFFAIQLKYMF